ncbi:MAG: hypothetical protein IPJ40_20670 [Saprospirales bacterium]|nr:hypothetical protein [Saprospirales bacterium]
MEEIDPHIARIKELIAADKLEEAFQQLQETPFYHALETELILLQSRLQHLQREATLGTIESNQFQAQKNKIILSLLELLKKLPTDPVSGEKFKEVTPDDWFAGSSNGFLNEVFKIFRKKGKS